MTNCPQGDVTWTLLADSLQNNQADDARAGHAGLERRAGGGSIGTGSIRWRGGGRGAEEEEVDYKTTTEYRGATASGNEPASSGLGRRCARRTVRAGWRGGLRRLAVSLTVCSDDASSMCVLEQWYKVQQSET
jgi:hypothetical protein